MLRSIAILLLLTSSGVLAEEAGGRTPSTLFTGEYLLQVFVSLAVVIGLMVGLLWILRRVNGVSRATGSGAALSVVASVGLGQRERAVLIEAGDKQILVGVAPGHIATLHVFDEPVAKPATKAPTTSMPGFAEVWKQAMGGHKDAAS